MRAGQAGLFTFHHRHAFLPPAAGKNILRDVEIFKQLQLLAHYGDTARGGTGVGKVHY
ncbi:hypothetical protein [Kosakonia oryziphila]|uniref:hypothetical protein n=1 Tax=Kosakonia oryziphila TaxID=1005667 RepID=UPI001428C4C9|nr:hypothetical protein [Kosakonia oryziphila]